MRQFLFVWLISFFFLITIDFIWFSFTAKNFYLVYLKHLFTKEFDYTAACIFYALYSFGITYILIVPAVEQSWLISRVISHALIIGFMSYGAYDLTNQATIKDWPLIVTIVDMAWGGFMTAITALITYKLFMSIRL